MVGIDRVAVIGAGNGGVTVAKYLVAEKYFTHIDVFEQRNAVGGLWIYTPENDVEESFKIPQTKADAPLDKPVWRGGKGETKEPVFISPMYEKLEANLPKMIMQHSDFPFADESPLFPEREEIAEYLDRYADDIRHLIRFETQVQKLDRTVKHNKTIWTLKYRQLESAEEISEDYDAVVLASGHFNLPFIPDIKGVREWDKEYPGSMSHSKHFRRSEDFTDKKVIAIGRGPSGLDISFQLIASVKKPLIVSTKVPGPPAHDGSYVQLPEIAEFLPASKDQPRAVRFANGHIETDIDHVIFATGFLYSFPFMNRNALDPPLISDGSRPLNLYKYLFYNADTTMAVIAMPQQIVPFPIVEAQGAVVARAWSGRLQMPSLEEMQKWEERTLQNVGIGKKWLWLKHPLDAQYLNDLHDWAMTAKPSKNNANSDTDAVNGEGKDPPRWGEKDIWIRERIFEIKMAFIMKGEARRHVTSLEDVGFDFEDWKRRGGKQSQAPSH